MVRGWMAWPRRAVAYPLAVVVAALAVLAVAASRADWSSDDLVGAILLLGCAALGIEGSRWAERPHAESGERSGQDLYPVWTLAAALLFPPLPAVLVALGAYAWLRVRQASARPYQWALGAASGVLGVAAAGAVYGWIDGPASTRDGLIRDPITLLAGLAAGAVAIVVTTALAAGGAAVAGPAGRAWSGVSDRLTSGADAAVVSLAILVAAGFSVTPWLVVVALPVVTLLARALLYERFQAQARTDPKTGLANATWWHTVANREVERAGRTRERVAILIADLDHFKRVNDTYGHLAGDSVLRAVANGFAEQVRQYDLVGRFGGEEFVVVLPATGHQQAVRIAERLRLRVAGLAVEVTGPAGEPVVIDGLTVSLGVASDPDRGTDLPGLMRMADAALYRAKADGRDRVRASWVPVGDAAARGKVTGHDGVGPAVTGRR